MITIRKPAGDAPTRCNFKRSAELDTAVLAYLAGSTCIDDLIRNRALIAATKRLRTFHRLARKGRPIDLDTLVTLPDMPGKDTLVGLLGRFERQPHSWPDRQAAGLTLLGFRFFPAGLLAALTVLAARSIASQCGRPLPHPTNPASIRDTKPESRFLEPWDDVDATFEALPSVEDDGAEFLSMSAASPESRAWLAQWLCTLGFDNTGVRIEIHAEQIAELASRALVQELRNHAGRGATGDWNAVRILLRAITATSLPPRRLLMLRRLEAVLRLEIEAMALPLPSAKPTYTPAPGRVLYLAHMRDPYELNGYVVRTHFVLKILSKAGFEPEPFTRLGFPNDLARHRTVVAPLETQLIDHVFRTIQDSKDGLIGRPLDNYIEAYADRIVAIAHDRRPAVIHAASNNLNGLAAIIAGRRLGIPSIYEVRGIWEITQASANDTYRQTRRYQLSRALENQAIREADHVVVISEQLRRFVIEHGARPDAVSVLPNGVDATHMHALPPDPKLKAELGIAPEAVVIGYAGSVVRYEGLDFVIEAMARLRSRNVKAFHFLLVGDGRELPALKALAAERGVEALCTFTGRVPRERVEALYRVIDIAPLPRRSLPVTELVPPLKPFEAMAAGKVVVVSNTAAIAETVIDGKTGVVVEKNSIPALTDALQRLISDPELREQLGKQGGDWVLKHRTAECLVRDVQEIYAKLSLN
ncbi:glycosyltransferase family 4 protein [Stappia sp. MMSF_3263]|uniref:glycosyltransferase family 4 protein n=1 Tax=Stappia sp. MMSF_3263 TaxID=3046693 RepID=UPI00273F41BD|nr:glycosyltransferase family 4 protein [Stappia sp. MMSF_3263]